MMKHFLIIRRRILRSFQKKLKRPAIRFSDIKRALTLNVGTLLFGAIFIYMMISILLYVTAPKITSYQVTAGPLSKNQTYTALALRSEQIVQANSTGYLTYYVRDNAKIKAAGPVFAVGETKENRAAVDIKDTDMAQIRSSIAKFSYGFQPEHFSDVYGYKYELEGNILEYAGLEPIQASQEDNNQSNTSTEDLALSQTLDQQTINFAHQDGLVSYSMDGYEDLTEDKLSPDFFAEKAVHKKNLRTFGKINIGDNVYKLITSEKWSLYVPLTEKQIVPLAGRETIRVKFLKDGADQVGQLEILTKSDQYYAKITFNSSLFRYASDRFLDIELVTNTKSGLKIPLTSIVNKDFYIIPKNFETTGKEQEEAGFLKEMKDKDDNVTTEFVNATLYAEQADFYYVDKSEFKEGDVIVKTDSNERYIIKDMKPLEGVYCINKGYAVFRKVAIIDQNEEYCIVETGTSFGIAQYDNIVFNSKTVEEEEILY
jgi:hypothetical protein